MSERLTAQDLDFWAERLDNTGGTLSRSQSLRLLMEACLLQIELAEARAQIERLKRRIWPNGESG